MCHLVPARRQKERANALWATAVAWWAATADTDRSGAAVNLYRCAEPKTPNWAHGRPGGKAAVDGQVALSSISARCRTERDNRHDTEPCRAVARLPHRLGGFGTAEHRCSTPR